MSNPFDLSSALRHAATDQLLCRLCSVLNSGTRYHFVVVMWASTDGERNKFMNRALLTQNAMRRIAIMLPKNICYSVGGPVPSG